MNNLKINPKVLPAKIQITENLSKLYILIQPFVVILGLSKKGLVANSTLAQVSFSFTIHLRKIDNEEPEFKTINDFALFLGEVNRIQLSFKTISFDLL